MNRAVQKLYVLHLAANAVIIWLVYEWLGIPDQKAWQLVLSACLAVVILFGALWLHGWTFAFFHAARGRLPAFAVWLICVIVAVCLLSWIAGFIPRASAWLSSALTFRLRKPVSPRAMATVLSTLIWIAGWLVLPVLLLPLASQVRTKRFWLEYAVICVLGAYIPYKLVYWVPKVNGLPAQAASVGVRFLIAYLLGTAAWLSLAYVSSGGRPRLMESKTSASP